MAEHHEDFWVQKARTEGFRSRSAFKLIELDEQYDLLRPGRLVVDLGAAPGGWCQVARRRLAEGDRVIGLDILPIEPIEGVEFIEGDFTEDGPLEELREQLNGDIPSLVMSDMAPNMSGMKVTDQARAMYLAELALDFAVERLQPGGDFLVKVFQGEGFDEFLRSVRQVFDKVRICKPAASRARSREVYVLACGYQSK